MLATGDINWTRPVNFQHPLNRGLVSWWLAAPAPLAGFGSNRWRDLCRRNDGTLVNMDPLTDWISSGWLSFDETDDRVDLTFSPVTGTSARTCAAWVQTTDAGADTAGSTILYWGAQSGQTAGQMWRFAVEGEVVAVRVNNGNRTWTAPALNDGSPHRVVVTMPDGGSTSDLACYMDGLLLSVAGTGARVISTPDRLPTIGAFDAEGYTGFFKGELNDIRVANRRWSASEVAEDYRLSRIGYPGLLNRIWTPRYAPQEAAVTGSSWYYELNQQLACYRQESY